jgi:hypothetical protein
MGSEEEMKQSIEDGIIMAKSISKRMKKAGLPEPSIFTTRTGTVVVDARNDTVFASMEFGDGIGATYKKLPNEKKGTIRDIDPYTITDEQLVSLFTAE